MEICPEKTKNFSNLFSVGRIKRWLNYFTLGLSSKRKIGYMENSFQNQHSSLKELVTTWYLAGAYCASFHIQANKYDFQIFQEPKPISILCSSTLFVMLQEKRSDFKIYLTCLFNNIDFWFLLQKQKSFSRFTQSHLS